MFAIFRLLSAVSAIVAFIQSPTGQRLIGQGRSFIAARASRRPVVVDAAPPATN